MHNVYIGVMVAGASKSITLALLNKGYTIAALDDSKKICTSDADNYCTVVALSVDPEKAMTATEMRGALQALLEECQIRYYMLVVVADSRGGSAWSTGNLVKEKQPIQQGPYRTGLN